MYIKMKKLKQSEMYKVSSNGNTWNNNSFKFYQMEVYFYEKSNGVFDCGNLDIFGD